MKNHCVGVIGCGAWGKNLVRIFHELNALAAICDEDSHNLIEISKQYPGVKTSVKVSDLLEDPSLDALAVATPSDSHYTLGSKVLLAGKDLYMEKPLALSYAQGLELVQLAERQKKLLMVGHILEYHPAITALEILIGSGELGKLLYVYSSRLNLGRIRQEENILWSFAPHDIAAILRLLREIPLLVSCSGGAYLQPNLADVTLTSLTFPSGVRGHLFVSWLHPYKEQKLIIVGKKKMAIFDDVVKNGKLKLLDRHIDWDNGKPKAKQGKEEIIPFEDTEPLKLELAHFLEVLTTRAEPLTSGKHALPVLKILEASQHSLSLGGDPIGIEDPHRTKITTQSNKLYFAHPSAYVDEGAKILEGTKIWHFCHISSPCEIGKNCILGQNSYVGPHVKIGNNVKIQNNVSIYEGVVLEDDVFIGPSCVFTNVLNPRTHVSRKNEFKTTLVKKGATLGANATILCGITVGEYAFVGGGAVVTKNVPPHALVHGNPARFQGWMCQCGEKLPPSDGKGKFKCLRCGASYPLELLHALEKAKLTY